MRSVRDVFVASFLLDAAGDGAFARGAVYERVGGSTRAIEHLRARVGEPFGDAPGRG